MRVITGKAKGRQLITLKNMDVRPTTDMVKEAVFSSIQFAVPNAAVLDLFSGSGQLGIEALSRGACSAVFVDNSKASLNVTKINLENSGLLSQSELVLGDGINYINKTSKMFDIVFLDPPYRSELILKALQGMDKIVNDDAFIICEHEKELKLPDKIGGLILKKESAYGKIKISIFVRS